METDESEKKDGEKEKSKEDEKKESEEKAEKKDEEKEKDGEKTETDKEKEGVWIHNSFISKRFLFRFVRVVLLML